MTGVQNSTTERRLLSCLSSLLSRVHSRDSPGQLTERGEGGGRGAHSALARRHPFYYF